MDEQKNLCDQKVTNLKELCDELKSLYILGLAGTNSVSFFLKNISRNYQVTPYYRIDPNKLTMLKVKMKILMDLKHEYYKVHCKIDDMLRGFNDVLEVCGRCKLDLDRLENESLFSDDPCCDMYEDDFKEYIENAINTWEKMEQRRFSHWFGMDKQKILCDQKVTNLKELCDELKSLYILGLAGNNSVSFFLKDISRKGQVTPSRIDPIKLTMLKVKMKILMDLKHEYYKVHCKIDDMLRGFNDVLEVCGRCKLDLDRLENESLFSDDPCCDMYEDDFKEYIQIAINTWEKMEQRRYSHWFGWLGKYETVNMNIAR